MRELVPLERDQRVTFRTTKGSFVIPAALLEDGLERELARHFAQRMPDDAKVAGREKLPNGDVVIRWRIIRVVRLA